MYSNTQKGPKNPFNKPLCKFQKQRQTTPIEQRDGENVKQGGSRDMRIGKDDKLVQIETAAAARELKQKQGSEDNNSNNDNDNENNEDDDEEEEQGEYPVLFSPLNSDIKENQLFINDSQQLNNSRLKNQTYNQSIKVQESDKVAENLSPNINTSKLALSPHSRNVFTVSNIMDTEYIKQDTYDKNAQNNEKYKSLHTLDSQILDTVSRSHHQLGIQQKSNQSPSQHSYFDKKQQTPQNNNNNLNNANNKTSSYSSGSLSSDMQLQRLSFDNNDNKIVHSNLNHNNQESNINQYGLTINNEQLINFNEEICEIEDEKGQKNKFILEKNKYPNESRFQKNNEYFLEEQPDLDNINQNKERKKKNEDFEEEELEQEFVSRNLDQKVKMIMDMDHRGKNNQKCVQSQFGINHQQNINHNNNESNYSSSYNFNSNSEPYGEILSEGDGGKLKGNEGILNLKSQSMYGYNFNNYKNQKSNNTYSPKIINQMGSIGINGLSGQNVMEGYNSSFQQGYSSFQQGNNSPSLFSMHQPQSIAPLTRNLSTNSFKTILKKDKNTFERTDSNRTLADTMNQDLATKKSGKVKFTQVNFVVNYEEDLQEKTENQYDDQMFQSDELEDDSLSLQQFASGGFGDKNGTGKANKNYLGATKITVLEKMSEKERESKMNSSLINSNLNIKESEIISSQSSNLIATKKKQQQIGSLSNANNTSSIVQDDQNNFNRNNSNPNQFSQNNINSSLSNNQQNQNNNIQEFIQYNQDSILLSQTYISPNHQSQNNPILQPTYQKDDNFYFYHTTNSQEIKLNGINNNHTNILNHLYGGQQTNGSIKSLQLHDMFSKQESINLQANTGLKYKRESQQTTNYEGYPTQHRTTVSKYQERDYKDKSLQTKSKEQQLSLKPSTSKSESHLKHNNNKESQYKPIQQQEKQNSVSDLKTNSVQSNLELIMAKIQITQPQNKNKHLLVKKKKGKTCSSSCNIFQFLWS